MNYATEDAILYVYVCTYIYMYQQSAPCRLITAI